MRSSDIRQSFLDFFADKGHTVVPSSSLVPGNDPTLLFTNAGMVPFKDVFTGVEKRDYVRATSSQRCVRAGGKHNDLENVGYTARHHTFFEMLGNFSFGDYFKEDAIKFAWEYLTEVLKLPKEKLWVSVYQDDKDALNIWTQTIKFPKERISLCGDKDNFWSMGDTGPCGPCSEIFYDHGEDIAGGPPGTPEEDGDRYIEIWNMVFMQYERFADGTQKNLPKPSVDTGMGLERIAAVMQDVHENYDIELFRRLIAVIADMANTKDLSDRSLRVIADHIRSTSFLISDGVIPSNEGRGYVLRRIIRRAIRHGNKLGINESFFHRLIIPLADEMGDAYPELREKQDQIMRVLQQEEEQFAVTLENGLKILQQSINDLKTDTIPGDVMFKLYDTYGFPVDLTGDIAREHNLQLDMPGFEAAMQQQRQQSQKGSNFALDYTKQLKLKQSTEFSGYDSLADQAMVTGLFKGNEPVETLDAGEEGFIVLDRSPFYAEGGGQVGDHGVLKSQAAEFVVSDTTKSGAAHIHHGTVANGSLSVDDKVTAHVDDTHRQSVVLNHSATHLLHAALRQVLGGHVQQKGSLVAPTHLRFDFVHFESINHTQLQAIEHIVNGKIRANLAVNADVMAFDDAKKTGAMALFGEKYGDKVRVLTMGDFSVELCGGTHVKRTGDIGLFKITSESGIAAGVRRIEAVTGEAALNYIDASEQQLNTLAQQVKVQRNHVAEKITQEFEAYRKLQKEYERLKAKLSSKAGGELASQAEEINGVKILLAKLEDADPKSLRTTLDGLKQKLGDAIVVLATTAPMKVSLIAGVTDNLTSKVKAGDLVKLVAEAVGGKGGGRADMAQAGGSEPENLTAAFEAAKTWIKERI
tara:strand:- start:9690 stop:12284 length:2595 start_codon:yes stop_codon:yes gene_type:complete